MLTQSDLSELTEFRHKLHSYPEISGEEQHTAQLIVDALGSSKPTAIVRNLGGHGIAAIFDSGNQGETIMFRAELDALPINELSNLEWRSKIDGKGHLCGHDGHMTILLALARLLKQRPIATGRAILLFQPAEETGSGARAVVNAPQYSELKPDWAFAIHNLPGQPLGHARIKPGLVNCASLGLMIKLTGKTAHAAWPEDGQSPVQAIAELAQVLGEIRNSNRLDDDFQLATITHIAVGEPSFGISPGDATLYLTLRTASNAQMEELISQAKSLSTKVAIKWQLGVDFKISDEFAASLNDPVATEVVRKALNTLNIAHNEEGLPMRASEDFGVFGHMAKAAMLCLGSGKQCPALHNPDYDFPDELIPIGASIFAKIAYDLLGAAK